VELIVLEYSAEFLWCMVWLCVIALLSEHMSPLHENQHRIIEMFHPTWGEVCMVAGTCANSNH